MKEVVGPLPAATFLVVLLQFLQGSTAMKDLHTCQVISITTNRDIAMLKLDFTHLSSTPDPIPGVHDATSTDTTTKLSNNGHTTNTTTKWPNNGSTSNGKINYSSQSSENDVHVNTTQATYNGNAVTEPPEKERISCHCQVDSKSTTNISVLNVMTDNKEDLLLLVNKSNTPQHFLLSEPWNKTFDDTTSVRLSVVHNGSKVSYSVILKVQGKLSNVSCTQSADIDFIGSTIRMENGRISRVLKPNEELIFETPLLVIGGVMAVIGSVFVAVGIVLWRGYLKKIKRAEKTGSGHSRSFSSIEDQDTQRKASGSSVSSRKERQDEASPTSQQYLDVVDGTSAGDQRPSPGTARYKRMSFGRRKKKQKRKTSKESENSSNVANVEDETYCSVQLEYEDIPQENRQSAAKMDTRVATPLLLLLKSGEQPHPLRKSQTLNQAQVKARSMPRMTVRQETEKNTYSHLNRLEKSHSDQRSQAATYDDPDVYSSADAGVRCLSTDAVRKNVSVFNFPKLKAIKKSKLVPEDNESMRSSGSNRDDQDHIYEAIETVETHAVGRNPSSQRYQNMNKGHQKGEANFRVDEPFKGEQRGIEETTTGASQSDTSVSTDLAANEAKDLIDGNNSASLYDDASTHVKDDDGTHAKADVGTNGTTDASTNGTADVGIHDTANAGTRGTADAGTHGTTNAGTHDTADVGIRDTADAGTRGTAGAGTHDTPDTGTHGTAGAGIRGTADAGTHDTPDTGTHGTADTGTHGTADVTPDAVDTSQKLNVEDSRVDKTRRMSAIDDILTRPKSVSIQGKHDLNLYNNPCHHQSDVRNSAQSPASTGLDKDNTSLHVLSGYTFPMEGPEVSPTSSRPDGINEIEAEYNEKVIDDDHEQYVIAHNILYESSSLYLRTSL